MTQSVVLSPWVDTELALLSSRGAVLFYIALNPDTRLKDIAIDLGITERRITQIVKELASAGFIDKRRTGRRNCYAVIGEQRALFPSLPSVTLSALISAIREAS